MHQIGISTNPLFRPPAWLKLSGDENLLALSLSRSFLEKLSVSAEYFVAMELSTHLVPCLTNLAKYFVLIHCYGIR